jgi:FtsH-binding integral membrane protein
MLLGTALGAVGFAFWAARITDLSLGAQWWCIVMGGAGIGLLLTPASTDAVNRAIDASYGEVTGITQTVRNYSASLSLAVLGTILLNTTTSKITTTLTGQGLPSGVAHSTAKSITQNLTGSSGGAAPAGVSTSTLDAIRLDFAEGNRYVLYGMAIALAVAFLCARLHPGTRVTRTPQDAEEPAQAHLNPGTGEGRRGA